MLGENIYKLRKTKGLSQEQLAELINVTRQTISNWELEVTAPNPEQLKMLSKAFNISIDELLNNNINNILVERVSNTEKLAGIIIKILKWISIAFIILLVIDIIAFIFFASTGNLTQIESSAITNCQIEDKNYQIEFDTSKHFTCENCTIQMKKDIKNLIDFDDISTSIDNIEAYFESNHGTCE